MQAFSLISEDKLAELKTDPEVAVLTHSKTGDMIAVRPPSRAQYRRFRSAVSSEIPDKAEIASENLLIDVLVFPERKDLQALLDRRPALADAFAVGVLELAGFGGKAEKKE